MLGLSDEGEHGAWCTHGWAWSSDGGRWASRSARARYADEVNSQDSVGFGWVVMRRCTYRRASGPFGLGSQAPSALRRAFVCFGIKRACRGARGPVVIRACVVFTRFNGSIEAFPCHTETDLGESPAETPARARIRAPTVRGGMSATHMHQPG